jgi:flagellin
VQVGVGKTAIDGNFGIYSLDDLDNIGEEMKQIATGMQQILSGTKFNNIDIFNTGLQISYGENSAQSVTVDPIDDVTLDVLINNSMNGISFSAIPNGDLSLDMIASAVNDVNKQRAIYGAVQNKLEHIMNHTQLTYENLQAAESRIRDADMAKEMTEYTKNNILVQSAQTMLAQASSSPQDVLQLLK